MSIIENIILALNGLRTSKMRSFLTMLGIIIGIGSVIAIVTVGNSLTSSITSSMDDLGANQIQGFLIDKERNTTHEVEVSDKITDEMLLEAREHFGDRLSSITVVEGAAGGQAKDGRRYANVTLAGTSENYLKGVNFDILRGSDIRERDVQRASNVCVVSNKFIEKMFPPQVDPLGKEVKIHTPDLGVLTFTIIGVYQYEVPAFLSTFAPDEDLETQMVIPVTTAKRIKNGEEGYFQFFATFPPGSDSYELTTELEEFFAKYYRTNPYFTVATQNMKGIIDQMGSILGTVSIAIAIIAGISLLVGGIGVMNIMLVSVTERTREIGTRKALGAQDNAIRTQFIVESMILCLIGGIIGVALGLILGAVGTNILGFPASPSVPVIVIAVLFSMVIGVFFGYYPANKAAKLDPIEALRYE